MIKQSVYISTTGYPISFRYDLRNMKRIISLLILCLSVTSISSISPASATGAITQGEWTLVYPDFSKLASDEEWVFEVRANGANEIASGDFLRLDIISSSGSNLALKAYIHAGANTKSLKLPLFLDKSEVSEANLSQPLVAKFDIRRTFSSKLKSEVLTFSIPTTTFPKRPSLISEYIKIETDFSKPFPFPTECTDLFFSYSINDPYLDIDQIDFDLVDSTGKSLSGAYSYGYRSGVVKGELSLCPSTLSAAKAPFSFQVEIKFESFLNKIPLISQIPFALLGKFSEVEALVTSMPTVCQKGSTFKTTKGECPSGYKKVNFTSPTTVQWNTLTRSASSLKGKKFLVYGCVAQFDSNTGGSKFRAYTLPSPAERYFNGANSLYTGSAKSLLKLSEDDAFAAKVTVSGATAYSTLGGRTSVPTFSIKDFIKVGSC